MDTIKLIINPPNELEDSSIKTFSVSVCLNNEKKSTAILNIEEVLCLSRVDVANFDLFTCDCGVPECAGFNYQVVQIKDAQSVKWVFPADKKTRENYGFKNSEYIFDRVIFEKNLEDVRRQVLKLEHKKIYTQTVLSMLYDDIKEFKKIIRNYTLNKQLSWTENRMLAYQDLQKMLEENFPNLIQKTFLFIYNNQISAIDYDFKSLVCRILNQFPKTVGDWQYLEKCNTTAKAIDACLNGHYNLLQDIMDITCKELGYEFETFDLHPKVHANTFDLKKLLVTIKI